jgi:hypothetical protein
MAEMKMEKSDLGFTISGIIWCLKFRFKRLKYFISIKIFEKRDKI